MILIKALSRLRSKVNNSGFSIAEALCAIIILLLATSGIVAGVQYASQEYKRSMDNSESKVLYSTLETVISNELRNTRTVYLGSEITEDESPYKGFNKVNSIFSDTYAREELANGCDFFVPAEEIETGDNFTVSGINFGKIYVGNEEYPRKLISSKSYGNNLGAHVDMYYDANQDYFRVCIMVANPQRIIIDNSVYFDVIPLNTIEEK